jgi:hypothetical protein
MRPGPFPWATDDFYVSVGNPWNNKETKIQPSVALSAEGWEPEGVVPADYLNWLFHRYHVLREDTARSLSMDFRQVPANLTPFANPIRRKYIFDQSNKVHTIVSTANANGSYQIDHAYLDGEQFTSAQTFPSKPLNANINGLAQDQNGHIVAVLSGVNDIVHYTTAPGTNYTAITWSGGAPALNWRKIDCDPTGPLWIIADDAGGGNVVAWSSTDGITFAAIAGFPAAMGAGQTVGLAHTKHPVGALGPDDGGNEYWICFNNTNMARSSDGITWSSAAHGLTVPTGGTDMHQKIAYSRTARRWVIPAGSGSYGDVYYSDDNGSSWATLSSVLSPTPTSLDGIMSDGYGTFVIYNLGQLFQATPAAPFGIQFWVSVDDGITWSYNVFVPAKYATTRFICDMGHFGLYDIGTPESNIGFALISHSGTACSLERSLIG